MKTDKILCFEEILREFARRKRELAAPMSGASKSAVLEVANALEAGAEALEQAIHARAICQPLAEIRDALKSGPQKFVIFEDCNGNQVAISHGMKVAVNFHDAGHSCIHSEGYYNLYAIVNGTVPEVLAKLRGES